MIGVKEEAFIWGISLVAFHEEDPRPPRPQSAQGAQKAWSGGRLPAGVSFPAATAARGGLAPSESQSAVEYTHYPAKKSVVAAVLGGRVPGCAWTTDTADTAGR